MDPVKSTDSNAPAGQPAAEYTPSLHADKDFMRLSRCCATAR